MVRVDVARIGNVLEEVEGNPAVDREYCSSFTLLDLSYSEGVIHFSKQILNYLIHISFD